MKTQRAVWAGLALAGVASLCLAALLREGTPAVPAGSSASPSGRVERGQLAAGVRPAEPLQVPLEADLEESGAAAAEGSGARGAVSAAGRERVGVEPGQATREVEPAARANRPGSSARHPAEARSVGGPRTSPAVRPASLSELAARTERLERRLQRERKASRLRRALGIDIDDPAAEDLADVLGAGPSPFELARRSDDPRTELVRLLSDE